MLDAIKSGLDFLVKAKIPVILLCFVLLLVVLASVNSLTVMGSDLTPHDVLGRRIEYGLAAVMMCAALALLFVAPSEQAAAPASSKPAGAVKYDMFLAVPMAGTETDAQYQELRAVALEVIAALRAHTKLQTCYFVGEKLATKADFESNSVAADEDFNALRASAHFIMIYPARMVSSVLAEAGFALAASKPSLYFVRRAEDLPFLLTRAEALRPPAFPPVVIHECPTLDDILRVIRVDGANLFPPVT